MAQDKFTLRVLTPSGLVLEESVASVTIPAAEGEIGILPGHARYTGTLGVGLLSYETSPGVKGKTIVVAGGFCTFSDDKLVVLADAVDTSDSIDKATLPKERESALKALEGLSAYDREWSAASARIKRAEADERLLQIH